MQTTETKLSEEDFKQAQSDRHTSMTHEYPPSPWFDEAFGEFRQYLGSPHLDIGARNGMLVKMLSEKGIDATGLEITDLADYAAGLGRSVIKGDIQKETPFLPGQFKSATMLHTLEHCQHPQEALKEILRIVDGPTLFIVPAQNKIDYQYAHYCYFESCHDLAHFLWQNGFEIIKAYEKGWAVHCVIAKPKK